MVRVGFVLFFIWSGQLFKAAHSSNQLKATHTATHTARHSDPIGVGFKIRYIAPYEFMKAIRQRSWPRCKKRS